MHGKSGLNEWLVIVYQGALTKAPPCPDRTLKTPLPQQSSPSAREEESRRVLMEDRRRRSIAFDNLAQEMLRYPDNGDDRKWASLNCKNGWTYRTKSVFLLAQQVINENGQIFEIFRQGGEELCIDAG